MTPTPEELPDITIESLMRALRSLPQRPAVLVRPEHEQAALRAVERLPWPIPRPDVIATPNLPEGKHFYLIQPVADVPIPAHHRSTEEETP